MDALQAAIQYDVPVARERLVGRMKEYHAHLLPWQCFCACSHLPDTVIGSVELARSAIRNMDNDDSFASLQVNAIDTQRIEEVMTVELAKDCSLSFLLGFFRACQGKSISQIRWSSVAQAFKPA